MWLDFAVLAIVGDHRHPATRTNKFFLVRVRQTVRELGKEIIGRMRWYNNEFSHGKGLCGCGGEYFRRGWVNEDFVRRSQFSVINRSEEGQFNI